MSYMICYLRKLVGLKMEKKNDIVRKIVEIVNNSYVITDSLILIKEYTPKFFVGANRNLPMLMRKSYLHENIVTVSEAKNIRLQVKKKTLSRIRTKYFFESDKVFGASTSCL